jgi:hypothetical protein
MNWAHKRAEGLFHDSTNPEGKYTVEENPRLQPDLPG